VTADENDHFAGSVAGAQPPGCDGVNTPCTYPPPTKGEIDVDLSSVLLGEFNNSTVVNIDFDDAPGIWINGNPAQTAAATRTLEQQAGGLTGFDPITGSVNSMTQAMADYAEQHLLHMVTSDPNRTPNFILFGNPDYFLSTSPNSGQPSSCTAVAGPCFLQDRDFAWNHGDFQKDIVHTWLGIVGPGVQATGAIGSIFTDHTDIRPTILTLAHLKDDYAHDGRVIFEVLKDAVLPNSLRAHQETLSRLAEAYKAINAPTGKLGLATLTGISTRALKSSDPSDATYTALEQQIVDLTQRRNAIAEQMIAMLEDAAFNGKEIDEQQAEGLIDQAEDLLGETTD
jgi:hypothetical protein